MKTTAEMRERVGAIPLTDGYIVMSASERDALLADAEECVQLTQVLNDLPAIADGIEDVKAGRIKSLSCVEGGCERARLQADKERLEQKAKVYDFLARAVSPTVRRIVEHAEACVSSIEQIESAARKEQADAR
jgi:hypothetical protein